MGGITPEDLHAHYELLVDEELTGATDGTFYFPGGTSATTGGFQLRGILDAYYLYVDVTDGGAGNWTVTVEAKYRGETRWVDVTNAWHSAASFTADVALDRSTATACLDAVRIKAVRALDGGANDGEITIKGSFSRRRGLA